MTAPQPATPGSDSVREELVSVIAAWMAAPYPPVDWQRQNASDLADAITDSGWVDSLRAEAKAEALEEAAHTLDDNGDQMIEIALGGAPYVHYFLCDRAAAYRTSPSREETHRQHRMDADCWCGPVQHPSGAWDHQ